MQSSLFHTQQHIIKTKMYHATNDDFEAVWSIFKPHTKTYFPHIRTDYLKRKIEDKEVIILSGVVITYGIYERKQKIGGLFANRGDAHIGQIVAQYQGNGAAKIVLSKFFENINTNVWLTVRSDNSRARSFYEKNGMVNVGDIFWSNGELPGSIYYKKIKS